jgi:hypothetical protein
LSFVAWDLWAWYKSVDGIDRPCAIFPELPCLLDAVTSVKTSAYALRTLC